MSISRAPYRGLNPYSQEDAKKFFGREKMRDSIIDNLMVSRLTVLYGESGVGKTSVLRAGVAASLTGTVEEQVEENRAKYGKAKFLVIVFPPLESDRSWKNEPLPQLKEQIKEDIQKIYPKIQPPDLELPLIETLQVWTEHLSEEDEDGELFIILDQFEEYFLYHPSEAKEGTFDFEFPRAVTRSRLPVNFLISISKESLAQLDRFKGRLRDLLENRLELKHLDWNSAREAIVNPIEEYYNKQVPTEKAIKIKDKEQFIKEILEDLIPKKELENLPKQEWRIKASYLQLVMESLWEEEMKEDSQCLRLQTFNKLGKVQGIADRHIKNRLDSPLLSPREQDMAASIFHYLVTPSGGKLALSAIDLAGYAKSDPLGLDDMDNYELTLLLNKLTQWKFRILRPVGKSANLSYEIFHDILAKPILSWRAGYVAKKEEKKAQQRAKLIRAEAAQRAKHLVEKAKHRANQAEHRVKQLRRIVIYMWIGVIGIGITGGGLTWHISYTIPRIRQIEVAFSEFEQTQVESDKTGKLIALARAMQVRKELQDPLNDLKWIPFVKTELYTYKAKYYLQKILGGIREKNQLKVGSPVLSVRFSPDGKNLAIISTYSAYLWNWEGDKQLKELEGYKGDFSIASFNFHQNTLATVSTGDSIRLFNVQDSQLEQIDEFQVHQQDDKEPIDHQDDKEPIGVSSIIFSPDGQQLAIGSVDGTVSLRNLQNQRLVKFKGHQNDKESIGTVWSISFKPDRRQQLATGSADGIVRLWNLQDNQIADEFKGHQNDEEPIGVSSISFSPDGQQVAIGSVDGTVSLRNLQNQRLTKFKGHQDDKEPIGAVWGISFSPDGQHLATGSADGIVRLWNLQDKQLVEFKGHQEDVLSVSFSPDGQYLATGSADETVRLWDLQERSLPVDESLVDESLDELLDRGCAWLEDYIDTYLEQQEQLSEQCPNPSLNDK